MRLLDSFNHELADSRILAKNTGGKQSLTQKRHSHKISGLVIRCCHIDRTSLIIIIIIIIINPLYSTN